MRAAATSTSRSWTVAAAFLLLNACTTGGAGPGGAESVAALRRVAERADVAGSPIDPVEAYRTILRLAPDDRDASLGLVRALIERGELTEAERRLDQLRATSGDDPDLLAEGAALRLVRGATQEALVLYDRAIALAPGHLRALNGAGVALDRLGRHAEAQARYRRALASDPTQRSARNNLGLSLALSGHLDEAVAILAELAQEPGALPRHRGNLALALALRGDVEAAAAVIAVDVGRDEARTEAELLSEVGSKIGLEVADRQP